MGIQKTKAKEGTNEEKKKQVYNGENAMITSKNKAKERRNEKQETRYNGEKAMGI